jgi:hypothetical protein
MSYLMSDLMSDLMSYLLSNGLRENTALSQNAEVVK